MGKSKFFLIPTLFAAAAMFPNLALAGTLAVALVSGTRSRRKKA